MTGKSKPFGEVFDAHTFAEFQTRDIEATMATNRRKGGTTTFPSRSG